MIMHEGRNSVVPGILSGTQMYDGRGNVIALPADLHAERRSKYGEHDFPAVEVDRDGMLHHAIGGLSISGKLDVNMLRGTVQCMSVRLRMPLVDELLYIRAAQSIKGDHEQNCHVAAMNELFNLAFNLYASTPGESIT